MAPATQAGGIIYSAAQKPATQSRQCPKCGGSGKVKQAGMSVACYACRGSGFGGGYATK